MALAQSTYTARVVDGDTGEPLPLVSVYLSEDRGTLTNFDGDFSIRAAPSDLLRFTCVGRRSLTVRADQLPSLLPMSLLDASMSEVTVKAIEGMLLTTTRKVEKAFDRKKTKNAQYFYRQTSVIAQKQDIVEAFIRARSAVNLRELQFLTGRHGRMASTSWEQSSISDMNLHHLLELGPMTKDAAFWRNLITPLRPDAWGNPWERNYRGVEYLQHFYSISLDEIDGDGQHLYRFNLRRNAEVEVDDPIMTGALYVDRATMMPLAFDGQAENLQLRLGKGQLRMATVMFGNFDVHIDYRYDRNFPEVADLSMQAKWGDFQTRTLLFNVEGQERLKIKDKVRTRENMLATIAEAGYDSAYWANNEVVKRTAEEQAIAQGAADRYQARIDSIAAAETALPPLQRLADRLARFGKAIPQEKVYIHMDNTSYFLGDTLWFAAYTRRTGTDTPSHISRVLYAELWNHDGYLVERKLIEMKDGRGHGCFALPDTLYSGYFELRAYTRWQLNWGQTEHYHNWQTEYWFYNRAMAKDYFRDYEKLYSRVFPVYDKPKQPGDFYRDMTLRPLRRYFKSEPKPAELRLSLFPEGGNLVAGVPCRVAFEAATSEGEVREGELQLLHGKEVVATARTENRGRGTLTFTPVEGEKYKAVFTILAKGDAGCRSGGVETVVQTIKSVPAEGVALQVHRDSAAGDWRFDLAAQGAAARQALGLTVMREGRLVYFEQLPPVADGAGIRQVHFTPSSPNADMASTPAVGVHQVTVFDSIGHVYADRLFFVTDDHQVPPQLNVEGLKEQYAPYEEVHLDIKAPCNPLLSLSIRDAALSDNTFDSGNILTEMLLVSEIKGFVPQPEYFFERDDEEHRRALDLLMLTQGWRRFNWQDMAVKGAWDLSHPAELTQMVTGTVNRFYPDLTGFDPSFDRAMTEHADLMKRYDIPLSEQDNPPYTDAMNASTPSGSGASRSYLFSPFSQDHSIGQRSYGWNLIPDQEVGDRPSYFRGTSHFAPFQPQRPEWRNDDYNVLNFQTASTYRMGRQLQADKVARRYLEEGSIRKEVSVHAEFINPFDESNCIVGEMQTQQGRFQIDLPRFDGTCIFHLAASDVTKWKKGKPHPWVKVDDTDEYSSTPNFPEFYVRLRFPYPRWVKPYTYYQVHNAPLRSAGQLPADLITSDDNLLQEVTVRARHGGLRRIDYTKPAYVLDAYDALNLTMDAGLVDYTSSAYEIGRKAAMCLIGDMGMERRYDISSSFNSRQGLYTGYLDQRRQNLLSYTDKIYIYTDYSPCREGDVRFEQSNQPSVRVDLRPLPDGGQRVTYVDRRYILPGFAYEEDFYHPDYQRTSPTTATGDYRRTLYWNPSLPLDAKGHAHIRFFMGSRAATLAVEAAGQAEDGTLLYKRP